MPAEPYVISCGDGESRFETGTALGCVERMNGRVEPALRADETVAAEGYLGATKNNQTVVGEEVFPQLDVESVIAAEARFYEETFPGTTQDAFEKGTAFFEL